MPDQWAIVFDHALQRFPREVKSVEGRIAPLQFGQHAQRLRVVIEALEILHAGVEHILAGMAERRMAEIVREAEAFGEIVIEPQAARHRAGNLRHFQRMRQPRAVVIALMRDEHLRLASQAPERAGMHDAVAVRSNGVAVLALGLGMQPSRATGPDRRHKPPAPGEIALAGNGGRRCFTAFCPLP